MTATANEMIADTYRHIYGLSVIGLRFFTVCGSWVGPLMAASISQTIRRTSPLGSAGPYLVDDIVTSCVGAVDKVTPSTRSSGVS